MAQVTPGLDPVQHSRSMAIDPDVTERDLGYHLVALDAEQIAEVAEVWRKRVQNKLAEIAAIASASEAAGEGKSEALSEALYRANQENIRNFSHYLRVLISLQSKGAEEDLLSSHWNYVHGFIADLIVSFRLSTLSRISWEWFTSGRGGLRALVVFVQFVLILFVTVFAARFLSRITASWLAQRKVSDQLALQLLPNAVFLIGLTCGAILALLVLGIDVTVTLAIVGGFGFLIAFVFQSILPNLSSGIVLQAVNPYQRGDLVSIDTVFGEVEEFNAVSTTVRTFDNRQVIIPNSKVWQNAIENHSKFPVRRIDLVFGIRYEDDIELAKETLLEVVNANELCLPKPAPRVFVGALETSSVNIYCRPWVRNEDYWEVLWELTESSKLQLEQAGICIAFPQQEVHIRTPASFCEKENG
ncbi:mechanosensitive ion channel family protein [Sedimentitalea sp. JM2-8]|uniref:Small-conductance mechanosensitive channel n=1 Tax=Sedimentitalea xiamensis TaxID=3050037 RepID=A0ABT7FLA6_9RHOB|nr:mechanosensitive ion channel family protein [Sedimentitalea xiamensis]MDK3075906.1 mechanosensitive ion channel family protein [Sedimentitalea xiamensis]